MLVGADRRRAGGAAGTTATTRTGPVGQGWLAMLDSIPDALAVHRATIYVQDEGLARKRFGVVRPSADAVRPAGVGITFPTEQGLRCGAACDAVGYLAAQRDGRGYSDLDIDRQVLVPALNLRVMKGMFDVGAVEHGLAATTGARDGITAPAARSGVVRGAYPCADATCQGAVEVQVLATSRLVVTDTSGRAMDQIVAARQGSLPSLASVPDVRDLVRELEAADVHAGILVLEARQRLGVTG